MKNKSAKAFVIFSWPATGAKHKMYVAAISKRPDNKIIPTKYVSENTSAKVWPSESEVKKAIDAIINPTGRKFDYEKKTAAGVPNQQQPVNEATL